MAQNCPCGSGDTYEECCGPIHRHVIDAPTAVTLMRARYSAFVGHDEAFLLWSWHPDHRPPEVRVQGDELWTGLEILATRNGGPDEDKGTVEFIARFVSGGAPRTLHEVSRFVRLENRWVYLKGRNVSLTR